MPRLAVLLAACLTIPAVHAASLKDFELTTLLEKVAKESSAGTPRAINEDILDEGYTANGNQLINRLAVQPRHAAQMRGNPDAVRQQLTSSVCGNEGYKQLLSKGAVLRYDFVEYKSNTPVTTELFSKDDCGLK